MSAASPRGTYLMVAADVRRAIEFCEFTAQLPSLRELATRFGVSRSTMERALAHLAREGFVHSRQGVGWFVGRDGRQPLPEQLAWMLRDEGFTVGGVFPTESALCERFGVSRTTMRSAVAVLEGRGLVGRTGSGRCVLALPPDAPG